MKRLAILTIIGFLAVCPSAFAVQQYDDAGAAQYSTPPSTLPFTGSDALYILGAGAVLILVGAGLKVALKRR